MIRRLCLLVVFGLLSAGCLVQVGDETYDCTSDGASVTCVLVGVPLRR